jgi:dissimilatory sulfite reductase (desulfoviridin) alpha/beta subunit
VAFFPLMWADAAIGWLPLLAGLATQKDRCTNCGTCTKAYPMSIDSCPRQVIAYTFSKGR